MSAPVFLTLDELLALHADQIARYGGSDGIRDVTLLETAAAMPQATFGGTHLHGTLAEMAAAYLYHIVANHAFIDGNKRAGLAAAIAFLGLNDVELSADDDALVDLVVGVAEGKITKAEVAVFLMNHTRPG